MVDLQNFFTNFLETIGGLLPGVLGAIAVLIIGWIIAKSISGLVRKGLKKTDLDNKVFQKSNASVSPESFISKLVYYIIMLLVLMVVLEMMGVENVLEPVKNLVNGFVDFIPNMVGAGIIGFAGYIIATIASEVLGFAGGKIDDFSTRMGLSNSIDLGKIVKQIVFLLVFFPILIIAIDTLGMRTLSEPLTDMLRTFLEAIPRILVASIIVAVFFIGGKYVTGILRELLRNLGVDNMGNKMGISSMIGGSSISGLASNVIFFFLMFTGIITAVDMLDFHQLSGILHNLFEMTGQIAFGLVIMVVGNFIATTVSNMVQDDFLSSVAKIATLALFMAIALRTMGIANDIINMAFGLTLGAVAVAVALSFGLGGREAAGKQMEHILSKFRKDK